MESLKEKLTAYLETKEGGWTVRSVTVPSASATTEDHWAAFKVIFSPGTMAVSGSPNGASAVWPSGGWTMDEEGKTITREDGVVMNVRELTGTSLVVSFIYSDEAGNGGTDGRIISLDGDYSFSLK